MEKIKIESFIKNARLCLERVNGQSLFLYLLYLLCLSIISFPSICIARVVDAPEAALATERWLTLASKPMRTSLSGAATTVNTIKRDDGVSLFHIVKLQEGGIVITSAETSIEPIIAFSESDSIANEGTPLYEILVADMSMRKKQVEERQQHNFRSSIRLSISESTFEKSELDWNMLLGETSSIKKIRMTSRESTTVDDVRVAPLIQAKWGQEDGAANYYTPNGYVCGCVALSGAMIAHYWQYPLSSRPSVSRTCSVNGVLRNFNSKGGTYNWELMPNTFTGLSNTQKEAIGHLCYDMGVATYMDWSSRGSGTAGYCLVSAFVDVFGYANARAYLGELGTVFSLDVIQRTILANLDAGCPVSLGIKEHEIIGDGYGYSLGTLYTHLNMGWSGSGNTWYNLPYVSANGYTSTILDEVIYNIFPTKTGELLTGRVLDGDGNVVTGVVVRASSDSTGAVSGRTNGNGIYALWVEGDKTWEVIAGEGENIGSRSVFVPKSESTEILENLYMPDTGAPGNSWGVDVILASEVPPLPEAPTGVKASSGTYVDRVRISWDSVSGAKSYTIYRTLSEFEIYNVIGIVDGETLVFDDYTATIGKTYKYLITASNISGESDFSLPTYGYLSNPIYPPNDSFFSDLELVGLAGTVTGSCVNATLELGETMHGSLTTGSVWWHWIAPKSGVLKLDFTESSSDVAVAFYTGANLLTLSEAVVLDDLSSTTSKQIASIVVMEGEEYHIAFLKQNDGGDISFEWSVESLSTITSLQKALDCYNFEFLTGGEGEWALTTDSTAYGGFSATSGTLPFGGRTWLRAEADGEGILTFKWKTSSETTMDFKFFIDGVYQAMSTSTTSDGWCYEAFKIKKDGSHLFTWEFKKSGDVDTFASVDYIKWIPNSGMTPIYRFYSREYRGHFYTKEIKERDEIIYNNPNWKYEGVAFFALDSPISYAYPVYRFWSKSYRAHFYTIDEKEKDIIISTDPNWKYEGIAYYALKSFMRGTVPVHRFWSKAYRHHFYTIDEDEKDTLIRTNPNWKYECIAFWALPSLPTSTASLQSLSAPSMALADASILDGEDVAIDEVTDIEKSEDKLDSVSDWTLTVESDGQSVTSLGEMICDGFTLITSEEMPSEDELDLTGEEIEGLGFSLKIPEGEYEAYLWNVANDELIQNEATGGDFDFELPRLGSWYWFTIQDDAGDQPYGIWMKAE